MTIGDRLREERTRLGLNQTDFAAIPGVTKNSQLNYEKGERSPDATYLAAVAERGVDILYVVTGIRQIRLDGLSAEGAELLELLPRIDPSDQAILLRTAAAFAR
ncbi:helix-turn-helix domain-containing protein [Pseudomonas entomophila]|uniref:helix-turn-helix domain-containing protein n=1 Tax=Pseudomonas entomophila TaxID=312306 RepID=UPI003EBE9E32